MFDLGPPVLHATSIVAQTATQDAHLQIERLLGSKTQVFEQLPVRPHLSKLAKILRVQSQRAPHMLEQVHGSITIATLGRAQANAHIAVVQFLVDLVPLDLKGSQGRDEVIDIAHAGHERGQESGFFLEVELASARPRPHRAPGVDIVPLAMENILHLPHDKQFDPRQAVRQTKSCIDQRRDIQIRVGGVVMKIGLHGCVRVFQTTHPNRTAAAQE